MPRILETDASALAQGIESMNPEERPQALDILQRYKQQQYDLGEPDWPAKVQEQQRQKQELHSMFTGGVDALNVPVSPWSENPQADKAVTANMAFLSAKYGKTGQEIADRYDFYRGDYAAQKWQSQGLDDMGFYANAAKEIQREKQVEETGAEGVKAALRGDGIIPALQAWQAKNVDRMPDSTEFTKGYLAAQQNIGDHAYFAGKLIGLLESNTGKTSGDGANRPVPASREQAGQFDDALAQLAEMKPRERKQIYASIAARAEAAGYDQKGFFAQMLSELGKGIARAGSTLGTQAGIAGDVASNLPALLASGITGNADFGPSTAEQTAMDASIAKRQSIGEVYDEVANVVAGTVDPVKATSGWMNETVEKGLIQAPGAVAPFMAASVVLGPLGAGALFTADFAEQNRRDLRAGGMDNEQAITVGAIAAPLQAAAESLSNAFQLGRFPAVQRVLSGFTKPIGGGSGMITRYGLNAGLSLATEYTEEQLQDNFIVPATQELLGALSSDVPQVDWAAYKQKAIEQNPQLLATLIPMALVFGGIMTSAQANLSANVIDSQDMMEAAGFSAAQANEVRMQPTEEAKITKARDFWNNREGTPQTMEAAASAVGQRMKMLQGDAVAAQKDLEQRGILPRMLKATDDRWRLTFNDGSTADFNSHGEADAARWQWTTDQLGKVHLATREALAQMEKNAEVGREFAVEFKPDAMTAQQAVNEGRADPAQIERRVQQGEATGESNEASTYDDATAIDKSSSDYLSSLQILGSSANEFKDGVLRTTIRLYEGAHVLTLVEEKLEGDAKQIVASKPGRAWMLSALRNYENVSGDKLFRDSVSDVALHDDDLIEAWSSLGQSYLVGKSKKGAAIGKGGARRIFADVLKAGMGGAMNAETQFFNAVWKRSAKLAKLKRKGKLGDDLTSELERQLGIDSQVAHETEAAKEADAIANEALYAGGQSYSEENPGPNGETFSVITPERDAEYIQAVENGDVTKQQAMVDAAANGAGYSIGPVWHGTQSGKFEVFSAEKTGGRGFYFSKKPEYAGSYAKGDTPQIITARLRVEKFIPMADFFRYGTESGLSKSEAVSQAKKDGFDGIEGPREFVVFNPSQIKSAAPVTYDSNGNVVPLSKRFNLAIDSISYSLRSGDFASRMSAAFSPFQRSPELRLMIGQVAKERALKLGQDVMAAGDVLRSDKDIEKERKIRYTLKLSDLLGARGMTLEDVARSKDQKDYETWQRFQESKDLLMKSGMTEEEATPLAAASSAKWRDNVVKNVRSAMTEAKAESYQWAETQKKAAKSPRAVRDQLKAWLRLLDGILAAAPPEVRAKVGGYVKLAGLATDDAMLKEVERRIEKLNVELEKWLKKEGVLQIERLLKKGRPDAESGKKAKGKDADMHHLFAAAQTASKMDAVAVAGELARLDALIASDTLTSEQEALATTERGLVELLGDLKHADAGRVHSALDTLNDIYQGGWLKWKLAQIERREQRAGMRHAFITDTGKTGVKKERQAMESVAMTLLGKIKGGFLSLSSFHEVLAYAFGGKSERVTSLVDAEREAAGQYEDANQALADELQDLFTAMTGDVLKGEQLRFQMAQQTIETPSEKLSQFEAIQALLIWRQEDGRRHMEGTRDEQGKVTSQWSYDQAWIDDVTAKLTPEGRRVMAWITAKYGAEHAKLNPLYRQRYGVNLPAHDNYAPITVAPVQTKGGETVDPVTGAAMASTSIISPGSLRTRSRSAIAEPEFRDAVQVLLAHSKQLEYWKAYYDLAVEASAVLGNREVQNAVKAKGGDEAAAALRKWVDAIAQGGFRDVSAGLGMNQVLNRMMGRAATVGLLGRFSTLLVQSTQIAAASVKMPVGAYLKGLSKLLTGNLQLGDAMRSDFIQRRFKSAPPIVRQAMGNLATQTKPNQITRIVRQLGQLLSGADAWFTGGTYAILLDYHRGTGRILGLTGSDLEKHAHTEAERDTEQVAQPTRMATRSLMELTSTNPLAKVGWAYASEARQKIALAAWSAANIKTDPDRFAKTAFLVFGVGGLMTTVLKNLWKDAKGDDDEKKWSAERLIKAAMLNPFHGVPGVSLMSGDSGMLSSLAWTPKAVKDLATGEGDMRDVDTVLSALGLFNDTAAGVAALSHSGLDAAKLIENAAK